MIGTTLDKYQVLQKVGEGGMATVYRGRHCTLDRTVAIKVLHPHLSSSVRNRNRFAVEARAIERLRHDNILQILDYSGIEGSDCYLVTEFVDGETLTEILHRRGKLPSEVAALVGLSLCEALGYAHTQAILHRDVKTDNVMVGADGTVKLMDFGIARFLEESQVTMTGALVGSPAFMSPEQAKEGKLDQRSDLFALGTVLFYLVTGHLPFSGTNPSLILKNVIEGNRPHVAELAPSMSAALADVIERLMATNPDDRFTQASDVAVHLSAAMEQARIDLAEPSWALAAWVAEPDAYEIRLDDHLKRVLVEEGRRLLAVGDHLTALRLLNRLLSMDEQNAEVMALVQGLHGEPPGAGAQRGRVVLVFAALAVLALAVVGLTWWVEGGSVQSPRGDAGGLRLGATADPSEITAPQGVPRPAAPVPSLVAPLPVETSPRPQSSGGERPAPRPEPRDIARPDPPAAPPPTGDDPVADAAAGSGVSAEDNLALVRLNTGDYVADVFLRGSGIQLGDTRRDFPLHAGTYELELRSPVLLEQGIKVTVTSGERLVVPVILHPRPSRVRFPKTWAADCEVTQNGTAVGRLAALDWAVTVQRPDQELHLALACPDGTTAAQDWRNLAASEVTFSP